MKKTTQKTKTWFYLNGSVLLVAFLVFSLFQESPSYAVLSQPEISALLAQGNEMFHQADTYEAADPERAKELYLKSIMRFEKVIKEGGIQNGELYYNIGNAYFRMRDLGQAILNYRRAYQFLPNDPNLRQNLSYARKLRKDTVEETQKTKIFKTLFFWHYDVSTSVRIFLFSVSFMLAWAMAALRIYFRKPFLRWGGFVSTAVALLLAGSLLVEGYTLRSLRPGVILDEEITARKGNSETYEPSFTEPLHAGLEFNLVEDRGNWYFIELPDSRRCWVPKESTALVR
jgi:tetratricopeptide (TPR) repeat protein